MGLVLIFMSQPIDDYLAECRRLIDAVARQAAAKTKGRMAGLRRVLLGPGAE